MARRASAFLAVLMTAVLGPVGYGIGADPSPSPQAYRIASGDTISISVWGQDRFSQECQVNGAGTISYPLLGDVCAAGLTCLDLQDQLQRDLQKYLKHPQVTVRVRQYGALGTSVFLLGEVKSPGVYPLGSGASLAQALAVAGGATSLASGQVTLVKARTREVRTLGLEEAAAGAPPSPVSLIEPGDVIIVNRKAEADAARRYAVLGEAPKPGLYDLPSSRAVSVLDAMQQAGLLGPDRTTSEAAGAAPESTSVADLEHALLTRGEVVVPLNLAALLQGDTSQNLLLQAGDVLTIPKRNLIAVYALGEVQTQGRQTLAPTATVVSLLNACGGLTPAARLSEAALLRLVDGQPQPLSVNLQALLSKADARQNLTLQEGDVLYVPAKGERTRDLLSFLPILSYLVR
jgi:polysaccharide export outer membrane protein